MPERKAGKTPPVREREKGGEKQPRTRTQSGRGREKRSGAAKPRKK